MNPEEIIQLIRSHHKNNICNYVILGDSVIDHSLFLEKATVHSVRLTDAESFRLIGEHIRLGGAAQVAGELAALGAKVLLMDIEPASVLDKATIQSLSAKYGQNDNIRHIPFRDSDSNIDTVTRVFVRDLRDRMFLRFKYSRCPNVTLRSACIREAAENLRDVLSDGFITAVIVIDLGRGAITDDTLKVLSNHCSTDTKWYISPYKRFKKFFEMNVEIIATRTSEVSNVLNDMEYDVSFLQSLSQDQQFAALFPSVKVLATAEYNEGSLKAFVQNMHLDTMEKVECHMDRSGGALIGTMLMFLSHYAAARTTGVDIPKSIIYSWGSTTRSCVGLPPEIENGRPASWDWSKTLVLKSLGNVSISSADSVVVHLLLHGRKIRLRDGDTGIAGIRTVHPGFRKDIQQTKSAVGNNQKDTKTNQYGSM